MITREGVIFDVTSQGKLYNLYTLASNTCTMRTATDWHRIMGHNNVTDILKLPAITSGMDIITDVTPREHTCDTCVRAKMTQTFSRKPYLRSTVPFHSVHADLSGPVHVVEGQKYHYILGIVDDYSGHVSVYMLESKTDTPRAFKQFLSDIAPYGIVKKLRSDHGTEFTSGEFQSIMLDRGIRHIKSAPRSPHQNGRIERQWRVLYDMQRALLLESGIPLKLWPYAAKAAAYLRNRCFYSPTQMTPIEAATGARPNMSNLALFGSRCFAYLGNHKSKFDPRSTPAVFLGMIITLHHTWYTCLTVIQ